MSEVRFIKVSAQDDEMRLNRWFLKHYPKLTMAHLQKLLRTKQIKVDGKKAETSLKLQAGQEVRVPPLKLDEMENRELYVSEKDTKFIQSIVIYRDENIIAINKPSGIAVQGGTNTVRHIDGMLSALEFDAYEKPKLVHRIDKETSGILVLARNRRYADILTSAFRNHKLQKSYLALVVGCPKKNVGVINAPLDKVGEKMQVLESGKEAVTNYEVLASVGDKFSLIMASPITGRTHQIRVHLEYIGHPIVGDDKYFGKNHQKFENFDDKLHLHAYKIDLSGVYNKDMSIVAELPEYFISSLNAIGIDFKGL